MKVVCTKENLQKGLGAVSRVVGKNASLPVLSHILLETENGRLKLSATNLELGAVAWVGCRVEQEGKITAPAHLLQGVVSSMVSDNVTLDFSSDMLLVQGGSSRSELCVLDTEDFPLIPRVSGDSLATLSATQIGSALMGVLNACSQSESRPEISGIYIARKGKNVLFAATDSYRLAESSFTSSGDQFEFILPAVTAGELMRLTSELSGDIEVFLSENQVFFKFHSYYLVSRLIDGQYPDYNQIVPKEFSTKAFLRKNEFLKAVKSVAYFSDKKTNDVRLQLKCDQDKAMFHVSAVSSDSGKGQAKLSPVQFEGTDQEIVVNYRYLIDGLSNIAADEVVVELNSGTEPLSLRSEQVKGYYYILMPINA